MSALVGKILLASVLLIPSIAMAGAPLQSGPIEKQQIPQLISAVSTIAVALLSNSDPLPTSIYDRALNLKNLAQKTLDQATYLELTPGDKEKLRQAIEAVDELEGVPLSRSSAQAFQIDAKIGQP